MTASPRTILPGVPTGTEVIQKIAAETDTILLAFGCGKDSTAAYLECRPYFKRIIPFYMYTVPGLEFVERSLRYYEEFFGTHIYRVPNPCLYRMLRRLVFQPPERCEVIEAAGLVEFDYGQLRSWLCDDLKLPADTPYASGVRAADSPDRRTAMKVHGPINRNKKCFYPVWDMLKSGLIELLQKHNVKIPIDYQIFGRSFDGLDHRFLEPISRHFPDDYTKILELFPLADLALFRAKCASEAA